MVNEGEAWSLRAVNVRIAAAVQPEGFTLGHRIENRWVPTEMGCCNMSVARISMCVTAETCALRNRRAFQPAWNRSEFGREDGQNYCQSGVTDW